MLTTAILIVDNDATYLRDLRAILQPRYQVFVARSAREALDILERRQFEVTLLTDGTPGISGLSLLKRVSARLPHCRNILQSELLDADAAIQALNSGLVWKYLRKPIDAMSLQEMLDEIGKNETGNSTEELNCNWQSPGKEEPLESPSIADSANWLASWNKFPAPVFITGRVTQRFLDCNQATVETYGYAPELLKKMRLNNLWPPQTSSQDGLLDKRQNARVVTTQHVNKWGHSLDVELCSIPIKYQGEEANLTVVRDISEQKAIEKQLNILNEELSANKQQLSAAMQQLVASNAQLIANDKALRQSEEAFRLISENTTDLIAVLDRKGYFVYASPSFLTVLGFPPETLLRTWFFVLIEEKERPVAITAFQEAVDRLANSTLEHRVRHRNGDRRLIEVSNRVIQNSDGKACKLMVIARDITKERQRELELITVRRAVEANKLDKKIVNSA